RRACRRRRDHRAWLQRLRGLGRGHRAHARGLPLHRRLPLLRPEPEVRQPERDARQGRSADPPAEDGGGIDVRELTDAELALVDARLPLHRLDTAQTYLVAWDGDEPVGHAHISWESTKLGAPEI